MLSLDLPSKEGGFERTGSRTPMQWQEGATAGFSTAPAAQLYLPVDHRPDRPTVSAQEADPNSLLNRVRALIRLRRSTPALQASANLQMVFAESGKLPLIYQREKDGQKVLVMINPSGQSVETMLPLKTFSEVRQALYGPAGAVTQTGQGWMVRVPPVCGMVYEIA